MNLKILKIKVDGRALYLAIIISFVASVLAFLFILSKHYKSIEIINLQAYTRLSDNVNSALNIVMQDSTIVENDEEKEILLYDDSTSNVIISKKQWGLYSIATARDSWKHIHIKRSALYGNSYTGKNPVGLYLADHGHYLAVGGDTYLSGRCFLPKLGARKAYIDGKSFKYNDIITGTIENSKDHLPDLSGRLIVYLKSSIFESTGSKDSITGEQFLNTGKISNSFENTTIRVQSEDEINLSGLEIEGNIVIQSLKMIQINKNTKLENCICIAPIIEVGSEFEGTVQLFATDTILIGDKVILNYPSSVVAAGIERSTACIYVGIDSRVEGTLVAFAEIAKDNNVSVRFTKGTVIYGTVYCAGKLELKSKITGSLFCNMFFLQTRQGYYENHLLDTWIDPAGLEPQFASGILFTDAENPAKQVKQIITWME